MHLLLRYKGYKLSKELPGKKYMAFLLRLWRENETTPWRATLENPHTGVRQGFSDPKSLFTFLQNLISGSIQQGQGVGEQEKGIRRSYESMNTTQDNGNGNKRQRR